MDIIKANELRKDNWLIRDKKFVQVNGLEDASEEYFQDWLVWEKSATSYKLAEYLPIELTPEFLLKIGFTKRFDTPDCCLFDMNSAPTWRGKFSLGVVKEGFLYLSAPCAKPFKYLHQLQNLYFAITQEELKINL